MVKTMTKGVLYLPGTHTGTGRRSTREHKTSCFLALFLRWFVARTRHHRAARSLPLATTL